MWASLEAHLGSWQVARVVHGAIIGLALVVALEDHPPAPAAMAGWMLGTAVTVALAEGYSEIVGIETSERHRLTRPQLAHLLERTGAVAFGVVFPAVFFVLAAVGLMKMGTAFTVAKWSGVGLIGFYGFWAARFAGAGLVRALGYGVLAGLIGAVLIVLKALVH